MEIQLNLNKICRLCLEEKCEQLQDVFAIGSNLCENILRATTVKIQQGDDLPTHVCQHCLSLVNVIVNFQRKCVVADLALHHYVRKCICHKEHKEPYAHCPPLIEDGMHYPRVNPTSVVNCSQSQHLCEAVKFYPRDPLQLTQVIKTEGGPCQIKSETSVFQLQEGREEVITGIIEEIASNPKVNVKPEMSEPSLKTKTTVKGRQRCISINLNRVQNAEVKAQKRRRRKGHRWKTKKQSSVSRRRDLDVHPEDTGPLHNAEMLMAKPRNGNSFPANKTMEEYGQKRISSAAGSSFTAIEGELPKAMKNKSTAKGDRVLKARKSESSNPVVVSKKLLLKETIQKTAVSSNSDAVKVHKNLVEKNPQSKRVAQNINTLTVEENLRVKRTSQNGNVVIANKKTASKEFQQSKGASETSKAFLANKKSLIEGSTSKQILPQSSSVLSNEKLVMEDHAQVRTRNSLSRKPVREDCTQDSSSATNQKPEMEPHIEIQRVSTPVAPAPSINLVDYKLVTEAQVRIEKVSSLINSSINKPITGESTSNQNAPQSNKWVATNQKPVMEKDVQVRNKTPEAVQDGSLLPTSGTFQPKEGRGQQNSDTFPANEKDLQNMSDNTVPTKRKITETESGLPEPLSTKKQKTQENDRLTKLVIQVEGNKLCCSQCDSWFEEVEELKHHLKELHNKRVVRWHTVTSPGPEKDAAPSFLCASCGKQFTSQRLFAVHQNQKSCF